MVVTWCWWPRTTFTRAKSRHRGPGNGRQAHATCPAQQSHSVGRSSVGAPTEEPSVLWKRYGTDLDLEMCNAPPGAKQCLNILHGNSLSASFVSSTSDATFVEVDVAEGASVFGTFICAPGG